MSACSRSVDRGGADGFCANNGEFDAAIGWVAGRQPFDGLARTHSGRPQAIAGDTAANQCFANDLGPFHAECQIDLIASLLVSVPGHGDERAETWSQRFGHLVNQDLTGRQKRGAGFFEPY